MRTARAKDYWRKVYKKNFSVKIDKIAFANVVGLSNGVFSIGGPITAICGANGVGKSTLLNSVFLALEKLDRVPNSSMRSRFEEASLSIDGMQGGSRYRFEKNDINEIDPLKYFEVEMFDAAGRGLSLIDFFNNEANLAGLDAYEPRIYDSEETYDVSYSVGKDYSECQVFEIDDFEGEFSGSVLPYFKVTANGITYGSEMMGLGELAIHLLYWIINRISDNSVLLLEEPETFIAPRAQTHLMNYLAKKSLEKSIWTIITTHSLGIVSNIPLAHTRLLYRENSNLRIVDNPSRYQLNTIIGVSLSFSGILLVEDEAAKHFLRSILDNMDPDLSRKFDVTVCGDVSSITEALTKFPLLSSNWLSVIGVYDGDMKTRIKPYTENKDHNWPYIFLPTNLAPEEIFNAYFSNHIAELAFALMQDEQNVSFALSEVAGCNHHDWLHILSNHLQIADDRLVYIMTTLWLRDANNKDLCIKFLQDLQLHLS